VIDKRLLDLLKRLKPTTLLDKFAETQPMSKEAYEAYKKLEADKTWELKRKNDG